MRSLITSCRSLRVIAWPRSRTIGIWLAITTAAVSVAGLAQEVVRPRIPLIVNVDYNRFRYADSSAYVELCFSTYPASLTLGQDSAGFSGAADIRIQFMRTGPDSIVQVDRIMMSATIKDTTVASMNGPFVSKTGYELMAGDYRVFIRAADARDPSRIDSLTLTFQVDRPTDVTSISDVELCSSIGEDAVRGSAFYKNTYKVIPNPSLVFGKTSLPVAFSYAELYGLDTTKPYVLRTAVVDAQGTRLKERTRQRTFRVSNAVDVSLLNVTSVPSGKYQFLLTIADTGGVIVAQSLKPIFIHNPDVVAAVTQSISARSADFAGMTLDELAEEFRRAKYIATDDEARMFERITSVEGRREFLGKFWDDVEKGTSGRRDMTRALYFDRVRTANERYGSFAKDGWLSDRGRVYILNGEPDEVERFPNNEGQKPHEIWHYYQIENGVIFVFVDRASFGNYQQVHSTKRGELQDDGWERYLQ